MKKRVLELLTSHGTLVSPDTMDYILTKNAPEAYVREIMNKFTEMPLYLTLDLLKAAELEQGTKTFQPTSLEAVHRDIQDPAGSQDAQVERETMEQQETQSIPEPPEAKKVSQITEIFPEKNDKIATEEIQLPSKIISQQENKSQMKPVKIATIMPSKKPLGREYDGNVKIIKDVTGDSTTEGTLKDFTKYFQVRFKTLRKILQSQRREVMGASEIAQIRKHSGPIKFVGLVTDVRTTKQGHRILVLEDETDSISALINNNSPFINMNFVNDEVICVMGKMGKSDLVYVEDIIQPDVPLARRQHMSELPLTCLFMSDIHDGSTTFLHKSWDKFMKWLNGKYSINGSEELRNNLKYIVVAGDIVDGIGIYPNQEAELDITDIYAQYEDLAIKFQDIPEHIQLIVQPGNHDAVRPAEPQPTFPSEITQLFSNDIKFVGNPCYFTINNVEILAYHGRSMDDFVMQLPNVNYNKPIKIMKEMLARRHLAPIYGQKTPIAPEHQDYLLIDRIPDIFVTGHIHKTAVESYRDISLINASAWQSQTSYQKMMNFNPEPGKIVLANLQTGKLNILDFN